MTGSPSKMRILIVDDEAPAREILREMLNEGTEDDRLEIIGECERGSDAVEMIRSAKPDLVFLDVQMPEMDGFGVVSALAPDQLPFIIFVTAYDRYAVRAFEVHALDYLLKPFDRERFDAAFGRAREMLNLERASDVGERLLNLLAEGGLSHPQSSTSQHGHLERLIVKAEGRVFFLRSEDIEWIGAEGNYVSLHVGRKAYLFREPISALELQLDPRKFRRVNRSTMVNIDFIEELHPLFRGEYRIVMHLGVELKLSRNYRDRLQKQIGGVL